MYDRWLISGNLFGFARFASQTCAPIQTHKNTEVEKQFPSHLTFLWIIKMSNEFGYQGDFCFSKSTGCVPHESGLRMGIKRLHSSYYSVVCYTCTSAIARPKTALLRHSVNEQLCRQLHVQYGKLSHSASAPNWRETDGEWNRARFSLMASQYGLHSQKLSSPFLSNLKPLGNEK